MRYIAIAAFAGCLMVGAPDAVFAQAPGSPDEIKGAPCTPLEVAVIDNRLHIKCVGAIATGLSAALSAGGEKPPLYLAIALSEGSAKVDAVLALATNAIVHKHSLYVWFHTHETRNPPGCAPGDCRHLTGAALR